MSAAAPRRHFEDFAPGASGESRAEVMTQAEILAFARQFDPQPIHTDPEAAAAGPFGGLIASGWHTTAVMMRLLVESFLADSASLVSPGIDELRWRLPVRPGDALRVRTQVIEATRSRSRPDRGTVRTAVTVLNQRDEAVMTLTAMNMFLAREGVA
jgi:acyl dehydratase